MADETAVQRWTARVEYAKQTQDEFNRLYGYDRALSEYRGEYASVMPVILKDKAIIPINEVKAYVKTLVPAIYSRDPYIAINPVGAKNTGSASILEKAVNSLWRELRIKREIKRCLVDAILGPWGWMKIGYSSVFGSIEPEEGQPALDANEFIRDEEIFGIRESYKRIVYDPNAIDPPYDCRWMAHKLVRPTDTLKASGIYKNTTNLQPNFTGTLLRVNEQKSKAVVRDKDVALDDVDYSVLWEIWDRDSDKVLVQAEGHAKFLMEKDWPKGYVSFPFVGITFDINPDENYPQNQISHWEPQLWEKIKLRSMQLDHIKRFSRQMGAEEGTFTPSEEAKYIKGQPGIIYRKKGSKEPAPLAYPAIQTDMYAVANAIDLDKDNLSGQSNVVRAAPQRTQSRTLGELDRLLASTEQRNIDPVEIVEDFSEEISRGIVGIMKEHITLPKYVSLTQEEADEIIEALGSERFDGRGFVYTKDDIQGDHEIDVRAGSTLPVNKENRIRILSEVLRVGQMLGMGPNSRVAKVAGRRLFEDLEMDDVVQAYDDDLKELEAQQEAQKMLAQANAQAVADGMPMPGMEQMAAGGRGTRRAPAPTEGGIGALPGVR